MGDHHLLERVCAMEDREIAIQLREGIMMGGRLNPTPISALFNTGMVPPGWRALIQQEGTW